MTNYFFIGIAMLCILSCSYSEKQVDTSAAIILLSDTSKQATCVYLTSDEKGQPVISWCENDLSLGKKSFYLAFFNKQQGTFSSRINIPIEQNVSLHEEGMPKIAIKADGTIIAVYETSLNSEKNRFAGFVRYMVSSDKGKTWTDPTCLHADTSSDNSHSFAAITRLNDGEVGACWLDQSVNEKMGGRPVKFSKTNGSNKFINELTIDSVACQCCRIAMSASANGKIAVAFRDILNDSVRDMSLITSYDNGHTFSPAVPFSDDGWVINGCPHNGPSLAATDSTTRAVWFTGGNNKGMYYGEINNNRELVEKQLVSKDGRFIQLCVLPNGEPVLAYNQTVREETNIYSKIVVNRIVGDKVFTRDISSLNSKASYPVLRPVGDDQVVIAWWENNRIYYRLITAGTINIPAQMSTVTNDVAVQDLSRIKLAMGKDPACGMPLSMSPGVTTIFGNKIYGFCSAMCKERFLHDPQYFIADK